MRRRAPARLPERHAGSQGHPVAISWGRPGPCGALPPQIADIRSPWPHLHVAGCKLWIFILSRGSGLPTALPTAGTVAKKSGPSGPPPGWPSGTAAPRGQGCCHPIPGRGRLHPAPEIRARHLLRAPAGNGTATVAGLYSTGTCPQKTGGSDDRLNAARAKPEERKRHRRACGKAKRHLPGLLLPLLPGSISHAGQLRKRRSEGSARVRTITGGMPQRSACRSTASRRPAAPIWRCRVAPGRCGWQARVFWQTNARLSDTKPTRRQDMTPCRNSRAACTLPNRTPHRQNR